MRWLTLYARSRGVPLSLAAVVLSALTVLGAAHGFGNGGLGTDRGALLVAAAVALPSTGLAGQDTALDRTVAIRWAPRRAAHLALIALLATAVLWALRILGDEPARIGPLVRDSAGLTGLAALGAVLLGGRYAWAPPLTWCSLALFVPPAADPATQVVTWMLQPPATAAATWTALLLAAFGTAAYALSGPRR